MTRKARPRDDPKSPTHTSADSGCEVGKCLECPLPLCRYEPKGIGIPAFQAYVKEHGITVKGKVLAKVKVAARAKETSVITRNEAIKIGQEVGISERQVYRIVKAEREKR